MIYASTFVRKWQFRSSKFSVSASMCLTRKTTQLLGPSVSASTSALEKRVHKSWSYLHLWRSLHSKSLYPRLWKSESDFQYISGQSPKSDLQFHKSSFIVFISVSGEAIYTSFNSLFISIYVSGKVKSSLVHHLQESLSCLHLNLWES